MSFPASLPGESNPNHKLIAVWVIWIRRRYDRYLKGKRCGQVRGRDRVTLRQIADCVGVSHETIRLVGLRRAWKHIPEE